MTTRGRARQSRERATISVEEAGALLGLSRSAAYDAVNNGSFPVPVLKINGRNYVARARLEQVLGIANTAGTRAADLAEAKRQLGVIYGELRALHAHIGIELDRLAALCGEADDTAAPTVRAAS